ncbi:hypothetical protein CFIICLFH_1775 [Methylobacterium goesingense]|nr:hypothetical protein CFIICLFH_1775 [Methylobacterium goesingense]
MIAFAVSLAARKGVPLPRGCKSSLARCRAFLDAHAGARAAVGPKGAERAPSPAMLAYARRLAETRGLDCPPEVEAQFEACRRFLDAHAAGAGADESVGRPIRTSAKRLPRESAKETGRPAARPRRASAKRAPRGASC